jgi:GTPase Era involved in 16S rRNA processing
MLRKNKEVPAMELTLTENDARTLRDFLRDHLQEVKFEVARTEKKDLRHTLLARQELVERILAVLDRELPEKGHAAP